MDTSLEDSTITALYDAYSVALSRAVGGAVTFGTVECDTGQTRPLWSEETTNLCHTVEPNSEGEWEVVNLWNGEVWGAGGTPVIALRNAIKEVTRGTCETPRQPVLVGDHHAACNG
jgi:hypothetical protein